MTTLLYPVHVLERLIMLRWVSISAMALMLALVTQLWGIALPLLPMVAGVVFLVIVTGVTQLWLRRAGAVPAWVVLQHLVVDVLVLAWELYFSGGLVNPFISLLVIPVTLGAVILSRQFTMVLLLLALLAYSVLMFFNLPLPPFEGRLGLLSELLAKTSEICGHHGVRQGEEFALHLWGMWLNFVLSVLIIAILLQRQTRALRARERELQQARETVLRQEKVLALGLQAAGAAHRLGTPLGTMALLLGELQQDPDRIRDIQRLQLLAGQITRCKGILADIVAEERTGAQVRVTDWVYALVDAWQVLRPVVAVEIEVQGQGEPPRIRQDRNLEQALQSLLDNAADASAIGVSLSIDWDAQSLVVRILDQGAGIDDGLRRRLGHDLISSEARRGMGIGFLLTNATIEHHGGTVEISQRDPAGSCVLVRLPLEGIAHDENG